MTPPLFSQIAPEEVDYLVDDPEGSSGFPAGDIALVQRGTCSFGQKVSNAQKAGAVGVIIFNEGQEGRIEAFGAHLDPVPEGPGINDNGSGSAGILEIA